VLVTSISTDEIEVSAQRREQTAANQIVVVGDS